MPVCTACPIPGINGANCQAAPSAAPAKAPCPKYFRPSPKLFTSPLIAWAVRFPVPNMAAPIIIGTNHAISPSGST